ncbi:hypothetical protein HU200_027056 [Digitaria exilis]|uniref:Uncharacterized protein n=1 Tax=Digitaria exilis TaxID=1010633 RepID=A0A835BYS4_9POAL|nr:hypothetical protein HU200_027056 [Digitaria exilis]
MAQEPPLDQHHHHQPSSKPPPPPPLPPPPLPERQADHHHHHQAPEPLPLRPLQHHHQDAAGTSGSSSGGSSSTNGGAGDWLRLGLTPTSPRAAAAAAGSPLGAFADHRVSGPPAPPLLRQAGPGIPQASITLPVPRAGPPWLPPWSPAAAAAAPPPSTLIPFGHRAFFTPGAGATGIDAIRVVLPPSAVSAAAGVWFALQASPHQGREPFLPQIPRSYLRIKDGRVTVRLLIKYLAGRLGLEDESEVWCSSQLQSPSLEALLFASPPASSCLLVCTVSMHLSPHYSLSVGCFFFSMFYSPFYFPSFFLHHT